MRRVFTIAGYARLSASDVGSTLALGLVCALAITRMFGVWGCS